jgi:cytochrome c-type biogenesis protein CcmE
MAKGPIITAIVAAVAFGGVIVAFSNNASPYVTISEARKMTGDHLHLAGDIVKDSIVTRGSLEFDLKDSKGEIVHVVHRGDPPANLSEAKKVVAIGGMQGNSFVSTQLLVKCPSKYEAADAGAVANR